MLKVGVIGFGGMGHGHARNYMRLSDCQLVAVADVRPEQLQGKSMEINLGTQEAVDMSAVKTYPSGDALLAAGGLDIVSVCLPTDMHSEYTVKALKAGLHVVCEKPMARSLKEADAMIRAQKKSGKLLMIGQCLRFWPCYEKVEEVYKSGEFGKLLMLNMRRVSACPRWAYQDWFHDGKRSGGALLDMHIHDTDYANYLLGVPDAVVTVGRTYDTGAIDNAVTQYIYSQGPLVMAETSWTYSGGFNMAFCAIFEKATLEMGYKDSSLRLRRPGDKDWQAVTLPAGGGHDRELAYFVECVKSGSEPVRCTPLSTRETMRIAFGEEKSALAGGKRVAL
jgi:1,5-anhydro-D-fructose reductase (1,5-anhydro-D-mannitol-forming)